MGGKFTLQFDITEVDLLNLISLSFCIWCKKKKNNPKSPAFNLSKLKSWKKTTRGRHVRKRKTFGDSGAQTSRSVNGKGREAEASFSTAEESLLWRDCWGKDWRKK